MIKAALPVIALVAAQAVHAQTPGADAVLKAHPRLLLPEAEEKAVKANIARSPEWAKMHQAILAECGRIVGLPPVERKMIGRRLLGTSREALRRIFFLSYAWRLTGDKKYFARCEQEMLAVAAFADWNPTHFLDVGEMSLAVAIGYDWLYPQLSATSRATLSEALIQKGITPSLDEGHTNNWWLTGTNNWNQVCNTGEAFAAVAVWEQQPQLAARILRRSVKSIQLSMKVYAPEGNYPEGYSYWAYGTSYNVFMISMLEQLFGTDYGLSQQTGFAGTAAYYENMVGGSGKSFNYSDAGGGAEGVQSAMFWFAEKQQKNSLLWQEKQNMNKGRYMTGSNRLLPAAMVWGRNIDMGKVTAPEEKAWVGDGTNPVALMRSGWQSAGDLFVGFKGGTPSTTHAHMDVGSFVMDAQGVRWSADLGMQNYETLESKGLKIWTMTQESERWKVFRYNNFSHSTLTVNGKLQRMKGKGVIIKHAADTLFTRAVMDMSALYAEQLVSAQRGIALVDKKYVTVRDEVETGDSVCTIRWAMLTPATVAGINKNQMQLVQGGDKKLLLQVQGLPENVVLQTWPANPPPNSYDASNEGMVLVGFEVVVPPHTKKAFEVLLVPGQEAVTAAVQKALQQW